MPNYSTSVHAAGTFEQCLLELLPTRSTIALTCMGTTWGSLLPGYDGMNALSPYRDGIREMYPSAVDRVQPQPSWLPAATPDARAYYAPPNWWTPVSFETDVYAVPTPPEARPHALNPSALGLVYMNPPSL